MSCCGQGLGEVLGDKGVFIYKAQLYGIGYAFPLPLGDVYDAPTSAAVLDFRRNAGLPAVDAIDDDFAEELARTFDYLAAQGKVRQVPVRDVAGGRQEDVLITAKPPKASGLGLLLLAAAGLWWASRR